MKIGRKEVDGSQKKELIRMKKKIKKSFSEEREKNCTKHSGWSVERKKLSKSSCGKIIKS